MIDQVPSKELKVAKHTINMVCAGMGSQSERDAVWNYIVGLERDLADTQAELSVLEGVHAEALKLVESTPEPPPEQEPKSFAPWRVPDPPRTDVAEALRPFVDLFEKSNERYRQRGGDPDQFKDTHPFREITAKELPLGVWRRAQAALRASQAPVRHCNHGAISPKGTMFYHGFVSNQFNQWRCDVCRGIYEGNLTEPMSPGSQALTLVSSPPPPAVVQDMEKIAWCQKVHEDLAVYVDDGGGQMIHVRAKRALGFMFEEMQKLEKALYPSLTKEVK